MAPNCNLSATAFIQVMNPLFPHPENPNLNAPASASSSALSRRDAMKATLATMGLSAAAFEPTARAQAAPPDLRRGAVKRYDMLKSINLWAFPVS
jgi:hypothetical protein